MTLRSDIQAIRDDLADIRDRLEALDPDSDLARMIIEPCAGALTAVLVALDHPDMRSQIR